MPEAAEYSVREHLRDDRPITIRALRPDDRAGMLAAIGRTSMQSLQRRFFVPKKGFSEQEMAFFLNIDFDIPCRTSSRKSLKMDARSSPVADAISLVQPGQAEIAFLVVDAYQGQGIGTILMRHLAVLARDAGLKELVAEVLPENTAMLKLFKKFGFRPDCERIASGGPPDAATALSAEDPGGVRPALPQPQQRAAIAVAAGFLPAHKTSGKAAAIPSLPLRVIDPFAKIEPDDHIGGAMSLRLRFITERRQRIRKGAVGTIGNDRSCYHARSPQPETSHRQIACF